MKRKQTMRDGVLVKSLALMAAALLGAAGSARIGPSRSGPVVGVVGVIDSAGGATGRSWDSLKSAQ